MQTISVKQLADKQSQEDVDLIDGGCRRGNEAPFWCRQIALLSRLFIEQRSCRSSKNPSCGRDHSVKPSHEVKSRMLAAKNDLFTSSGTANGSDGKLGPLLLDQRLSKGSPQIAAEVSDMQPADWEDRRPSARTQPTDHRNGRSRSIDEKTDTPQFVVLDNDDAAALLPIKLKLNA